jgi:hypothetical protein
VGATVPRVQDASALLGLASGEATLDDLVPQLRVSPDPDCHRPHDEVAAQTATPESCVVASVERMPHAATSTGGM